MAIINKLLSLAILVVLVMVGFNFIQKEKPIFPYDLVEEVFQDPRQQEKLQFSSIISYNSKKYEVTPVADYDVWGLIVRQDRFRSPFNVNPVQDALNLKNICIVWGDNLEGGDYKKMKYRLKTWSCMATPLNDNNFNPMSFGQLHLLPANLEVQEDILAMRTGDQVHLTGALTNYVNQQTGWEKKTPLIIEEEDTENGKVMLVNNVEILKQGNLNQHLLYETGLKLLMIFGVLKILMVLLIANFEVKKLKEYEEESRL